VSIRRGCAELTGVPALRLTFLLFFTSPLPTREAERDRLAGRAAAAAAAASGGACHGQLRADVRRHRRRCGRPVRARAWRATHTVLTSRPELRGCRGERSLDSGGTRFMGLVCTGGSSRERGGAQGRFSCLRRNVAPTWGVHTHALLVIIGACLYRGLAVRARRSARPSLPLTWPEAHRNLGGVKNLLWACKSRMLTWPHTAECKGASACNGVSLQHCSCMVQGNLDNCGAAGFPMTPQYRRVVQLPWQIARAIMLASRE